MRRFAVTGAMVGFTFWEPVTLADGVPPVTLTIQEQESNRFLAQWRVPRPIPPRAIPAVALPESCKRVGERDVTERPGAGFVRETYDCKSGLSGQAIGIDYPFFNATVSTLLRIELLDGTQHTHMFAPGEKSWSVPAAAATDLRGVFRELRRGVLDGLGHFAANPVHLTFALAIALLGGLRQGVRLTAFFTVGQVAGLLVWAITGFGLRGSFVEIGVAAGAALLAREALRPPEARSRLLGLASSAGLLHGLGLPEVVALTEGGRIGHELPVVLGMDVALMLVALFGSGLLGAFPLPAGRGRKAAAYAAGVGAVAVVLGFPVGNDALRAAEARGGLQLPNFSTSSAGTAVATSQRVAAPFPETTWQTFVNVAPFEVRHEVLVRLRDEAGTLGLDPAGSVTVDVQTDLLRTIGDLARSHYELTIDGEVLKPVELRVDFLGLDSRGALPRAAPVDEPVETAWVGVTSVYVTEKTPNEIVLAWRGFDAQVPVPATVTDPESSRSIELSAANTELRWRNELSEDPTPVVTAVSVEPRVLWLPVVSLGLVGLSVFAAMVSSRRGRPDAALALARIGLAGACVLAPAVNVSLPLPFGGAPDAAEAKRILARLLPNVYRAFEFPTESVVYDRLALTVTGDTLTEIYLEHRRVVRMEERGGARVRVEAVEVLDTGNVGPDSPAGFVTETAWTVGGTVTHFGHRHFRQNRYDARVSVVPVEGRWKIRSIEILDEKRLR